jgi:hypothetical protein
MTDTLEAKVEKLLRAKARHASAYRDRADALEGQIEQQFREPLLAAFKALARLALPPECTFPIECDHAGDDCAICEGRAALALLDQDVRRGADREAQK